MQLRVTVSDFLVVCNEAGSIRFCGMAAAPLCVLSAVQGVNAQQCKPSKYETNDNQHPQTEMKLGHTVVQLLQICAARQKPDAIEPVCLRYDEPCTHTQKSFTLVLVRLQL